MAVMSTNSQPKPRVVGVTVLPEYLQSETVDGVFDRLQQAGVTAVTTSPYVMEAADEQTGGREPPIDAGAGAVRLLDRPLWGKRELWVRTSPSFEPDRSLYAGLRYQPPHSDELTTRCGHVVDDAIRSAHERGMKIFFQVQAAIPPGYRVQFGGPHDDDRPRLPDGRMVERRVANNGSLASPHIIEYADALIRDICLRYPELDGIRFDWPEYPPYFLDDWFVDFSDHARAAARWLGYDFQEMRRAAEEIYAYLHEELTDELLADYLQQEDAAAPWDMVQRDVPGFSPWLDFKAHLVDQLLGRFRQTMNAAGGAQMEMLPNAFPPPWSLASGFDFERVAERTSGMCVKLYGMHWGMMVRFYAEQLLAARPGLSEALLIQAIVRLLDLADEPAISPDEWRYPGPDEPHPGGLNAQQRKIRAAQQAAGETPVYTLAHGYGPLDDFRRRLEVAHNASPHGVWFNRYGYLSDAKLQAIGEVFS